MTDHATAPLSADLYAVLHAVYYVEAVGDVATVRTAFALGLVETDEHGAITLTDLGGEAFRREEARRDRPTVGRTAQAILDGKLPERGTDGQFPRLAWPGLYPIRYFTYDGSVVCSPCASREIDEAQAVVACEAVEELPAEGLVCMDCGTRFATPEPDPSDPPTGLPQHERTLCDVIGDAMEAAYEVQAQSRNDGERAEEVNRQATRAHDAVLLAYITRGGELAAVETYRELHRDAEYLSRDHDADLVRRARLCEVDESRDPLLPSALERLANARCRAEARVENIRDVVARQYYRDTLTPDEQAVWDDHAAHYNARRGALRKRVRTLAAQMARALDGLEAAGELMPVYTHTLPDVVRAVLDCGSAPLRRA